MNREVLRQLREIPLGTHGILLWNEISQMVTAAKAFVEGGLRRDEQVVFALVGHEREVESVLKDLALDQEAVTIIDRAHIERVRSAAMEGDLIPKDLTRRTLVEEAKRGGEGRREDLRQPELQPFLRGQARGGTSVRTFHIRANGRDYHFMLISHVEA